MSLIYQKLDDSLLLPKESVKSANLVSKPKLKRLKAIYLLCSVFLLLPNYLPNFFDPFSNNLFIPKSAVNKGSVLIVDREFSAAMSKRFTSVDAIVYYVNKHIPDTANKRDQLEQLIKIVRSRFCHAYAVYGMQDNWLAAVAGKFVWRDLAAKVIADDILKDPNAACSQVAIVLMDCLQVLNIPYRKVGLNGHYALEALVQGKWYFIDANLKPDFNAISGRKSLSEIVENKELVALYANTMLKDSISIVQKFSKIEYGEVNVHPAPRAHLFHLVTKLLSKWLWLLPLVALVKVWIRQHN